MTDEAKTEQPDQGVQPAQPAQPTPAAQPTEPAQPAPTQPAPAQPAPVAQPAPTTPPAPEPTPAPQAAPAKAPEPMVTEEASDDYIQFDLKVGKRGGRTINHGVIVSKEQAQKHGEDLPEMITRQLSRQVRNAVEEIINLED